MVSSALYIKMNCFLSYVLLDKIHIDIIIMKNGNGYMLKMEITARFIVTNKECFVF